MTPGANHYANVVNNAIFGLFMLAWSLLALDTVQQVRRLRKKQKEKKEWE